MNNKRKVYLSLLLLPLLVSCSSAITSESFFSSDSHSSGDSSSIGDSSPEEEEDIYEMGYTNIDIDGETYYLVTPGLYVNKEPGVYKQGFNLKFAYNKNKGKLYYNYAGEKPVQSPLYYLAPFANVEIYENAPENNDEIPMTTAVDAILNTYEGRCVSYNYIDNIQNTGNYAYFHNACVVDITFIKEK